MLRTEFWRAELLVLKQLQNCHTFPVPDHFLNEIFTHSLINFLLVHWFISVPNYTLFGLKRILLGKVAGHESSQSRKLLPNSSVFLQRSFLYCLDKVLKYAHFNMKLSLCWISPWWYSRKGKHKFSSTMTRVSFCPQSLCWPCMVLKEFGGSCAFLWISLKS